MTNKGFRFEAFSILEQPINLPNLEDLPKPKLIGHQTYFEANAEINLTCLDGERETYVDRNYGKNTVMHQLNWKSHLFFSQLGEAEQESYRET